MPVCLIRHGFPDLTCFFSEYLYTQPNSVANQLMNCGSQHGYTHRTAASHNGIVRFQRSLLPWRCVDLGSYLVSERSQYLGRSGLQGELSCPNLRLAVTMYLAGAGNWVHVFSQGVRYVRRELTISPCIAFWWLVSLSWSPDVSIDVTDL